MIGHRSHGEWTVDLSPAFSFLDSQVCALILPDHILTLVLMAKCCWQDVFFRRPCTFHLIHWNCLPQPIPHSQKSPLYLDSPPWLHLPVECLLRGLKGFPSSMGSLPPLSGILLELAFRHPIGGPLDSAFYFFSDSDATTAWGWWDPVGEPHGDPQRALDDGWLPVPKCCPAGTWGLSSQTWLRPGCLGKEHQLQELLM